MTFQYCDVWDFRALVDVIAALPAPHAVVSNSDHLQAQTALAADYFGLPGKDWRSALRAKDKALMRRQLALAGLEHVTAAELRPGDAGPPPGLRYPVVLKPAGGVASEDVMLVTGPQELAARSAGLRDRRPGEKLLAEPYLPGELRTLETSGTARRPGCSAASGPHCRRCPTSSRKGLPGPRPSPRPSPASTTSEPARPPDAKTRLPPPR